MRVYQSNSQVADIFTKALGILAFTRLSSRLGLIDIFVPKSIKPHSQVQVTAQSSVQDLRGGVSRLRQRGRAGVPKQKENDIV